MKAAHFGLFRNQIRNRYPKTEERPTMDPVVEKFPEPIRRTLRVQFPVSETPPLPRFWFVDQNENELLQVQFDRFIRNWRRTGEGDSYPRYEKVKELFEHDFEEFREFVSQEKLGAIEVNQCEVTYVNHIVAGDGWSCHEDLDKVLTMWRQPSLPFPGRAEDAALHARFLIKDNTGRPVGRLHADVQAAVRNSDNKPMFILNLTARGMLGKSIDFFDLGREWIVRSFAEMTTTDMHQFGKGNDDGDMLANTPGADEQSIPAEVGIWRIQRSGIRQSWSHSCSRCRTSRAATSGDL